MSFTRTDKSVLNRQNNRPMPMLTDAEKEKRDAFIQKEKSKIGNYFDYRDKKFNPGNRMNSLLRSGIQCQETSFAK